MKSIQEAVASVQNAFPSIYTKDDVIKLLESIETPKESNGTLMQTQIEDLCSRIFDHIKENVENLDADDICDKESAEFELYGNEISLSDISIDTREIARNVVDGVGDVIETFFEELNEEIKEENN